MLRKHPRPRTLFTTSEHHTEPGKQTETALRRVTAKTAHPCRFLTPPPSPLAAHAAPPLPPNPPTHHPPPANTTRQFCTPPKTYLGTRIERHCRNTGLTRRTRAHSFPPGICPSFVVANRIEGDIFHPILVTEIRKAEPARESVGIAFCKGT